MATFKTPQFWQRRNWISALLTPFSAIYALGWRMHQHSKQPFKVDIPVICVGNAVMGGSGKTPTVIAFVDFIKTHDLAKNPYVLTRGYGGSITSPTLVDPKVHNFEDVGDEALLIARHAPVIKSPDRAEGAKLAIEKGTDMIIMDDGLHNTSLHQDIKILVVDSHYGFGNERLFPSGPLRAPLRSTINKADIILTIGKRTDGYDVFSLDESAPTLWAYINSDKKLDTSKPYIAFAGIGLPQKFKRSLEKAGAKLIDFHEFPDHHVFTEKELQNLKQQAEDSAAILITTEKDFIRIPLAYHDSIATFPIHLEFEAHETLLSTLKAKLKYDENATL